MKSFVNIRVTVAVLATLVCGAAVASPPAEPSKAVSYADVNLKSSAGIEALYTRIKKAASEVCQIPSGTHQIRIESELKACKAGAVDRAVVDANLPSLVALHQSKTGRKVDSGQYADRR